MATTTRNRRGWADQEPFEGEPMAWMRSPFAFSPFDVEPTSHEMKRDRFVPVFSIHEGPRDYDIEADVPGAKPTDVRVEAHGRDVVVRCAHVLDPYSEERHPEAGQFTRRLHLSHRVNAAHVATEVRDGVLHVHLQKAD